METSKEERESILDMYREETDLLLLKPVASASAPSPEIWFPAFL